VKILRCEMMYERVLWRPDGGDLQDRVENYFLAWSNSLRRDLIALGVLESSDGIDALLSIRPADMTEEQLENALALLTRQTAVWGGYEAKRRDEIEAIVLEASSPSCEEDSH
jgi:hypothetical protein